MNITETDIFLKDINGIAIDPSTLVDGRYIKIDINLPKPKRVINFIKQIGGNPLVYKHDERIIKVCHPETDISINDIIRDKISQ